MGTHRSYARLTAVELSQALQDRDWAKERLNSEDLDVDKAWSDIDIVFAYAGVNLEEHIGRHPIYVENAPGPDEYGWDEMSYVEKRGSDPYYLTPEQVLAVTPRITAIPFDIMFDSVDPARVQELQDWQKAEWPDYRDYATFHGVKAQRFFKHAAEAGDAIAVWFR
jgi:hypothetical protein